MNVAVRLAVIASALTSVALADSAKEVDTIIVGAGLSGMTAAYRIHEALPEHKILILEANNRIGGRTWSYDLKAAKGTDRWDLGGQWLGKTQRDIWRLVSDLKVEKIRQFADGWHLAENAPGTGIQSYKGVNTPDSPFDSDEVWHMYSTIQDIAAEINPDDPFDHENATHWGQESVLDWLQEYGHSPVKEDCLGKTSHSMMGSEAKDTSFLYFVYYLASSGAEFDILSGMEDDSAQSYRIQGGSMSLSDKILSLLPEQSVIFSQEVASVDQGQGGGMVKVVTRAGLTFAARNVIIAIPPRLASELSFNPPLSLAKSELLASFQPTIYETKFVFTYKEAFWRKLNYSGYAFGMDFTDESSGTEYPPVHCYDATSQKGNPALIGFSNTKNANLTSTHERSRQYLRQLERFYGKDVYDFIDFADYYWDDKPFSRGCIASLGPGKIPPDYARLIRAPVGRVHWAGTETATAFMGYMSLSSPARAKQTNAICTINSSKSNAKTK